MGLRCLDRRWGEEAVAGPAERILERHPAPAHLRRRLLVGHRRAGLEVEDRSLFFRLPFGLRLGGGVWAKEGWAWGACLRCRGCCPTRTGLGVVGHQADMAKGHRTGRGFGFDAGRDDRDADAAFQGFVEGGAEDDIRLCIHLAADAVGGLVHLE